jgi:hypothetical protein
LPFHELISSGHQPSSPKIISRRYPFRDQLVSDQSQCIPFCLHLVGQGLKLKKLKLKKLKVIKKNDFSFSYPSILKVILNNYSKQIKIIRKISYFLVDFNLYIFVKLKFIKGENTMSRTDPAYEMQKNAALCCTYALLHV